MSGELQGEDEPGEDGMQHMWVSNTLGPTTSFIPSDMCASQSLKIHIFLYIFQARGPSQNTNTDVFFMVIFHLGTRSNRKKTASNGFSHAYDNSPSFSFSMDQTYILQDGPDHLDGRVVSKVASPSEQQGNQRRKCATPVEGAKPA